MKKSLISIVALVVVFLFAGCKGGTTEKPKFKFYAKVNGTEWKCDMVEPNTTPTEGIYISNIYCSATNKYLYMYVVNPVTKESLRLSTYLKSLSNATGTYAYDFDRSSNFEIDYKKFNVDNELYDQRTGSVGTLVINKFTYDFNSGKVTAFDGTFSGTIVKEHIDDVVRTSTISEGEINNLTF
jgi:hypothetical protein